MKKNYIHHTTCAIVLLGAMVAGLWSCQTDYLAEQNNKLQGELKITVIDNGYTAGQALNYEGGTFSEIPQTRATENGYKTTFTAGDKIGLYAVKGGSVVATNVCLTLTNVGGALQWKPDTGVKIPADADRYFAYYPYQPSGSVNSNATTADEFFSNTIANWSTKLGTDQSTTYPSKDLMVGMGTLGATPVNGFYPLDITLTHKMGLAVIKLPASATDIKFNGFTPYAGVPSEYRYLVEPNKLTLLSCNFKDGGEVRGFAIAPTIAAGQCKTYTVSGKPTIMSFGIDLTQYPSDMTYILPFRDSGNTGNYTLTVDWGDGKEKTIIPPNTPLTFSNTITTALLTHTYDIAKEYVITISSTQTDFTKAQMPEFRPGDYRTIKNNPLKLKSLHTPLLRMDATTLYWCFKGCKNLIGPLPPGLFENNPQVTSAESCFLQCTSLTGPLPAGLFAANTEITTFKDCFYYCTSLSGNIPEGLFANNKEVTNFYQCFDECTSLTGTIPEGLFANCEKVTNFSLCFYKCAGLTGLLPARLFAKNTEVTNFNECFKGCTGLTGEIPEGLFAENRKAISFSGVFSGCTKLTMNANIFCNEQTEKTTRFAGQALRFSSCFWGVGSDNVSAGTAPALWSYEYGNLETKAGCFRNIGKVTNETVIPVEWK